MNNIQKFENFLESLKGNGDDSLIESVKQGFQACFEDEEVEKTVAEKLKAGIEDVAKEDTSGLGKVAAGVTDVFSGIKGLMSKNKD